MAIAQRLYENGFITYMRTDSVNLSTLAVNAAKEEICQSLGEQYSMPRNFTTKTKGAQEAHESIRPTYMNQSAISGDKPEQTLYDLIYKRTLASQMADAKLELTNINIKLSNNSIYFQSSGEVVIFDGFLRMYMESNDDDTTDEIEGLLPVLKEGEKLDRQLIKAQEQYTLSPPRYTEASLVKKMEALGIGRPSTYAPTITTVQNRGYVIRESRDGIARNVDILELVGDNVSIKQISRTFGAEKKKLFPSDIGMVVTDYLSEHFNNIMDYNFTARAEEAFDNVAEGSEQWQEMIAKFYIPFHQNIELALANSERNSGERSLGVHPETGENVSVRIGRFGPIAQIGEGESVRYAGLLKGQLMETITLEDALALFKFPRKLGLYEDKEISIGIGRFGPYIRHNSIFVSLKKDIDDPATIDYDTAIVRIEEKRETDRKNTISIFESGIKVLNGRFGPYISFEKTNYEKLTEAECQELIEKESVKGTKKTAATKKTAVKKSTEKKTATTKKTAEKTTKKVAKK